MGVTDKMWDAITTVIRMNDKVERLAGSVKAHQGKLENLTERVIRLETALEIALASQGMKRSSTRQIGLNAEGQTKRNAVGCDLLRPGNDGEVISEPRGARALHPR